MVDEVMRNRFIAWVQAALTFLLVGSFIFLLATGKADAATAMKDFTGMAVMFWLMRHRVASKDSADGDADPTAPPPAAPEKPPTG